MTNVISMLDSDGMGLDKHTIHDIISIASSDVVKNNTHIVTVDPVNANRYKGNLFGLLKNVLDIPNSAIYINMVINGYKSSLEYNGKLQLRILDPNVGEEVVNLLNEQKVLRKDMGG